jgi:hypothetical protein
VINIIPHENRTIVIYKGEVKFPGAGEVGDPALEIDGHRVAYDELNAWYRERMMFDWRGQPFHLNSYRNGRVQGAYSSGDSIWAREQGLDGSGYEGWLCDVPESEIGNLRVERFDLLEDWRYAKTFGVEPPEDLFNHVRPATDQEWIKG